MIQNISPYLLQNGHVTFVNGEKRAGEVLWKVMSHGDLIIIPNWAGQGYSHVPGLCLLE